jgi:hypothetical protein
VKIRNDLLKMETGITALSMAGLVPAVSVNGKKEPELVGQPLSIYGTDETNPVFFRRPGNVLPMFSLFSTANLMLANIVRSTSNQVNKSTSPDVKRKGSVRVTLPEDKSKGNVMVYVDSAARPEVNELCHSLINQTSCIQLESGLHEDTSSIFAVTGVRKVINKQVTSPTSLIRDIKHKNIDGPIFEFNTGKMYDTTKSKVPNLEQWSEAMDSYIKDVNSLITSTFGPPGALGVDHRVESLLKQDIGFKAVGISAYGYVTRKKKSSKYYHDKDTIACHNPAMSLLYSIFQHISSEEAISHVENELSMSMGKLDWQQLYKGKETYEVVVQRKIEEMKNSIYSIKQDLFRKIRSVRGQIDKKLKTPVFFRYFVSKQKSVTSGKMNFVHLLNKPSKSILEKIYNIPENNTGDLCNAVISEMTHGGSMFNTPYMVLYHKQQKRQPISNAQRKQIYGRNARNCSMYLKPQNMIKRIDLKTTNSSFFYDDDVFVETSNSPSPQKQIQSDSPSVSKGDEESANTSPSPNSRSPSASRNTRNDTNNTNRTESPENLPTLVTSTRTRKKILSDNVTISPAKTIPNGVETFGIKTGKTMDTAPLRHFSTYMGYDPDLFQCGNKCDLTQQLYTFARRVCNSNITGVLLGQSKVMRDNVRQLLQCDRDRKLVVYDSNSEVDRLKSHRGMKSTDQNLIFENMRERAANAKMFKDYIRGDSAADATENNTVKERGENTPKATKGVKLIKYKFAVQLMRTGLYEHWLKHVEKETGSVIADFTKRALDAKVPPSRIKSDLTKNEEYVSFKKSPRRKTIAMNYGTFSPSNGNIASVKKLSLWNDKSTSEKQAFDLLFSEKVNASVSRAGWNVQEKNQIRTGVITKKDTSEMFKYDRTGDPVRALQKYLLKKNKLNEKEQTFLRSRGETFLIHSKPIPQVYLRQIPILVKENMTSSKLTAGLKLVNIRRKKLKKMKPLKVSSTPKVASRTVSLKTSVKQKKQPEKTKNKKPNKINKKLDEELAKTKYKVMMKKTGTFKVMYSSKFSQEMKVSYDPKVKKCFDSLSRYLTEPTTLVEIKTENGETKCKTKVKDGIKEITINHNS